MDYKIPLNIEGPTFSAYATDVSNPLTWPGKRLQALRVQ